MVNKKISVSTEPTKTLEELLKYVDEIKQYTDYLHFDIMDGKFVEKTTFSDFEVAIVNNTSNIVLDVHLMVNEPLKVIKKYVNAGANIITVHFEAFKEKSDLIRALKEIKSSGCLVGISICPQTSVEAIEGFLSMIDIVLVMSVNPGKSGQEFILGTHAKLNKLSELRKEREYKYLIQVDGGINPIVVKSLNKNDYDILVSGSYIFNGKNKKICIDLLKM